jgi:two-component system chemotaxis response regulator CheY
MKRILLVDDSRTVRSVCRDMLAGYDMDIVDAENGAIALEIVRSQPPFDVVLLDWNMPVMNGITFLETLMQEQLERRPVVIMCTTENDMSHIGRAIKAGASEYIMKPFDESVLEDKLQGTGVL